MLFLDTSLLSPSCDSRSSGSHLPPAGGNHCCLLPVGSKYTSRSIIDLCPCWKLIGSPVAKKNSGYMPSRGGTPSQFWASLDCLKVWQLHTKPNHQSPWHLGSCLGFSWQEFASISVMPRVDSAAYLELFPLGNLNFVDICSASSTRDDIIIRGRK